MVHARGYANCSIRRAATRLTYISSWRRMMHGASRAIRFYALAGCPTAAPYGPTSTTYVDPVDRRAGIADRLLDRGEVWIRAQGMVEAATWTTAANTRLIDLYQKHGYAVTEQAPNDGTMMVRLTKALAAT
jgi:GNAT superfamily N-acetyltransferase